MTEQNIRLIVSDIDGTLLDDHHRVDPQLRELMPRLRQAGIPFVLASARSPLGIEPIARELGLEDSPLACYNGALVLQGQSEHSQILIEHPLRQAELQGVIAEIEKIQPQTAISLYSGSDWTVSLLNPWIEQEAAITGEQAKIGDLSAILASQTPVHKLLLIDQAPVIQSLHHHLKRLDFLQTDFYLSKDNYLEITAKGVSKEQALSELARCYGVSLAQTMAVGDNFNDLPMLRLAGLGIAMGNAPQEVRQAADAVTASNNDQGLALAIKEHVLL